MNTTARRPISPGTLFEYRLARLRYCQGYFVRRSIDVWPVGLEGSKLAELDCLAVNYDPQLRNSVEVIECKTGSGGTGEVDRVIWLNGVKDLVSADTVTFAKLRIAERTRELARRLKVDVLDESAIATAERDLGVPDGWWPGFHDPTFGEEIVKSARAELTSSVDLRRVGKFLFGSYWFTDDFTRIKQLRTLYRLATEHRDKLSPAALGLAIGEATALFVMTSLSIAAWCNQLATPEFKRMVSQELSTGLGDPRSLRNLLRRIDDLRHEELEATHRAYQQVGVARMVLASRNLEAEILTPPEWVDAYLDLLTRLFKRSHLGTDLVRWTDLWAATRAGNSQQRNPDVSLFHSRENELQALFDLVAVFLNRIWNVPSDLLGVTRPVLRGTQLMLDAASTVDKRIDSRQGKEPGSPTGEIPTTKAVEPLIDKMEGSDPVF